MNVTDNASPVIQGQSIYGDFAQAYPQMGTAMVNPMGVGPSELASQSRTWRCSRSRL